MIEVLVVIALICGNITEMIPSIREIAEITIFHVGPWTDLERAADFFGDATLDVCLESLDVYQADEESMRARVTGIVETYGRHGARSFSIRPGILQAFGSIDEDLAATARWVGVAKETVAELAFREGGGRPAYRGVEREGHGDLHDREPGGRG